MVIGKVKINSFFIVRDFRAFQPHDIIQSRNACHTFSQTFIVSKIHYHILLFLVITFHVLWTLMGREVVVGMKSVNVK